jgi:drug/metabolite transporter (DMT)-like permease
MTTLLWYWLVTRFDLSRVGMVLFLVPALGLGIAAIVFGVPVGGVELLGVGFIVAAAGLAIWDR